MTAFIREDTKTEAMSTAVGRGRSGMYLSVGRGSGMPISLWRDSYDENEATLKQER